MAQDHAEFEVASVKPNLSASIGGSIFSTQAGDLNIENITLRTLIAFAYDVREFQIIGGPKWLDTDRYDIVAKPPHDPVGVEISRAQRTKLVHLMAQALLASRFQLVEHAETKELPVYALVLAKNGPQHLAANKGDNPQKGIRGEKDGLQCMGISMETFASRGLAPRLRNIVLDQTGLTGEFDFELHFVDDGPPKPGTETAPQAAADPAGPSLAAALQEQLGLKLETRKAPVEVIVIDRAEKASAN
jgi:uncharacterized protein (TIGR03435 family)